MDHHERAGSLRPDRESYRQDLTRVRETLLGAHQVAITTHVNADGDGAGSELAMAEFLSSHGVEAALVNPTPFPHAYRFLLEDRDCWTPDDGEGRRALEVSDTALVLDTSERSRLGRVAPALERTEVVVMDHHPATPESIGDVVARRPDACATGELVHDLLALDGGAISPAQARALYVALVTDTGSFRFGNTTPRAHEITAELLRAGVDVEQMFRLLFARYTRPRLDLLRRALDSLREDPDLPVAWLVVRQRDLDETGATAEDREGLVEYARRLEGVEVAVLFRELRDGRSKVSIRSNGEVDVAEVARDLGGGGHPQAAGALLDRPLRDAEPTVLDRVRRAVRGTLGG